MEKGDQNVGRKYDWYRIVDMSYFGLILFLNIKDKPEAKKPESEEPELEEAGGASGAMSVESLRKYLSDKLGIHDKDEEEKIKILDDVSMDGIVDYIKKKNCKNIITMAGAGISTCKNT